MATTNPIHHHLHGLRRRHSIDLTTTTTTTNTNTLPSKPTYAATKLTTIPKSISSSSSSTAQTSSSSSSSKAISFDLLEQHLSAKNYRLADEETRRLLIVLAGEAAEKRGYVFFSEVQFISQLDLKAIDDLWRLYSDNRFGYSVQKRIWEKENRDFSKFFIKVGWMKKLDTEVEQYNYRSFPTEFIWELNKDTPSGHLPLTNALRGTQLLTSIFNHPAFDSLEQQQEEDNVVTVVEDKKGNDKTGLRSPPTKTVFKPDYSF